MVLQSWMVCVHIWLAFLWVNIVTFRQYVRGIAFLRRRNFLIEFLFVVRNTCMDYLYGNSSIQHSLFTYVFLLRKTLTYVFLLRKSLTYVISLRKILIKEQFHNIFLWVIKPSVQSTKTVNSNKQPTLRE